MRLESARSAPRLRRVVILAACMAGCGAPSRGRGVDPAVAMSSTSSTSSPASAGDGPPSSAILGVGAPELGGPLRGGTGGASTAGSSKEGAAREVAPASAASGSPPEDAASKAAAAKADKSAKITARHILVQWMGCDHVAPSVVRTRDQAHVVIEEVLRRAKAGEDFARLAVEYSDEPNAGARGGSLGRFGRGQMVKSFEEAAFALAPGEISGIVESPFGFHVIQRLE